MNPVIERFLERPLWQKLAFWLGSLAFLSYLIWQFLIKDLNQEQVKLEDKISSLNSSIVQEQRIARELGRFKQEVKDLEVKLQQALSELPDAREIPGLLTSISNLARDSGLQVSLFKPMPENYKEFYAEVPVSISANGSFHQLTTFFDEVGHLSRIVNISQINLKEPKIAEEQITLKADCVATTFRYLDEEERQKHAKIDKKKKRK
jgi:type IV pilus assembly protein PilO